MRWPAACRGIESGGKPPQSDNLHSRRAPAFGVRRLGAALPLRGLPRLCRSLHDKCSMCRLAPGWKRRKAAEL